MSDAELLAYRLRVARAKLAKVPRTKRLARRNVLVSVAKAHLDILNEAKKKPKTEA